MRKKLLLSFLLFLFLVPGYAFSYVAYFGFDESIEFNFLSGFQFDVVGAVPADLTLTFYRDNEQQNIDGNLINGAFPTTQSGTIFPWTNFRTTSSIVIYDQSSAAIIPGDGSPLGSGIALSLVGDTPFNLNNFIFSSDYDSSGAFPFQVFINQASLTSEEGISYTASQVPIPPALLLFGSGLIGLVGLRRKIKN
jgi:hypothetical protein